MRGIEKLHPVVRQLSNRLVGECKARGLSICITDTIRTKEEQDKLYAQGRTAPGKIVTNAAYPASNHCWGIAFDICRNDGLGAYFDLDGLFSYAGRLGCALGLSWGGDWTGSLKDKPHFEYLGFGGWKELQKKYKTPEKFMQMWKETPEDEILKEESVMIYNFVDDNMPAWARPTIQKLLAKGFLHGNEKGELGLTDLELKIFVVNDRAGCYGK